MDGIELPKEKLRADLPRLHPGILHRTLDNRNPTAYIMSALMNNIWEYNGGELLDPELNQIEKEVRLIARQLGREGEP